MLMASFVLPKIESIEYIISVLNSFHRNVQFTYHVESNAKLPSLGVLLMRNDEDITAIVHKKTKYKTDKPRAGNKVNWNNLYYETFSAYF